VNGGRSCERRAIAQTIKVRRDRRVAEMFELAIADVGALAKAVSVVAELVGDANFSVGPEGLSMQAMDSSHVCLVALDIEPRYFESFVASRPSVFGIKLGVLKKVLECCSGKTSLAREEEDSIVASSEHARFSIKLLDIDSESVNPSSLGEQDVLASIDAAAFLRIVRDLASFGDVVELTAAAGDDGDAGFEMTASGDIGEARMRVSTKSISVRNPARGGFSVRYLATFAKAASVASEAALRFSDRGVLSIEYAFGDGAKLSFYIAPKIDDEDE
jgi:proliferating cell nuclear antigen